MKQYNVFPECNVDTNLVGYLLGGYPKHKSSCNEVVKAVNASDQFAVGIIDADKRAATMDAGFAEYRLFDLIAGYPELQRLRNTLKYLMHKQYDADPEEAKAYFDGRKTSDDLALIYSSR